MRTVISTPIRGGNKKGRRGADEWCALIREFSCSGETRAQFCERHGVALSTFGSWRSRLRHESTTVSEAPAPPASALFIELCPQERPVAAVSESWDMELELGGGVFLRLRRGAC